MSYLETVAIRNAAGGRTLINKRDFDETKHELWEDAAPTEGASEPQTDPVDDEGADAANPPADVSGEGDSEAGNAPEGEGEAEGGEDAGDGVLPEGGDDATFEDMDRETLEAKATELGVSFRANTPNETILKRIRAAGGQ